MQECLLLNDIIIKVNARRSQSWLRLNLKGFLGTMLHMISFSYLRKTLETSGRLAEYLCNGPKNVDELCFPNHLRPFVLTSTIVDNFARIDDRGRCTNMLCCSIVRQSIAAAGSSSSFVLLALWSTRINIVKKQILATAQFPLCNLFYCQICGVRQATFQLGLKSNKQREENWKKIRWNLHWVDKALRQQSQTSRRKSLSRPKFPQKLKLFFSSFFVDEFNSIHKNSSNYHFSIMKDGNITSDT